MLNTFFYFSPEAQRVNFFDRARQFITQSNAISLVSRYFSPPEHSFLFMDSLWREFSSRNSNHIAASLQDFENFITPQLTDELIQSVEIDTKTQASTQLWCNMRIGRITASNLHEISRCTTLRGKKCKSNTYWLLCLSSAWRV